MLGAGHHGGLADLVDGVRVLRHQRIQPARCVHLLPHRLGRRQLGAFPADDVPQHRVGVRRRLRRPLRVDTQVVLHRDVDVVRLPPAGHRDVQVLAGHARVDHRVTGVHRGALRPVDRAGVPQFHMLGDVPGREGGDGLPAGQPHLQRPVRVDLRGRATAARSGRGCRGHRPASVVSFFRVTTTSPRARVLAAA